MHVTGIVTLLRFTANCLLYLMKIVKGWEAYLLIVWIWQLFIFGFIKLVVAQMKMMCKIKGRREYNSRRPPDTRCLVAYLGDLSPFVRSRVMQFILLTRFLRGSKGFTFCGSDFSSLVSAPWSVNTVLTRSFYFLTRTMICIFRHIIYLLFSP